MTTRRTIKATAVLLALCMLVVGGLASAQAIAHESHHAHHQKATHGTVLCSWMCAAGQGLDGTGLPLLIEQAPLSIAESSASVLLTRVAQKRTTSRGPPSLAAR